MNTKYVYIGLGIGWYYMSNIDRAHAKKISFEKGHKLSQRFKKYPSWDKYMEPFMVNQFAFLFGVGNSFIKGLISDNEPNQYIKESLDDLRKEISD